MVRSSLDPGSPHVNVSRHGDGLTSLQFRRTAGADHRGDSLGAERPRRPPAGAQGRHLHDVRRPLRRSLRHQGDHRRDAGRRRLRRHLRLLAQRGRVRDGRAAQRPADPPGEGRLRAVSRLHRQQRRAAGRRDRRAPHRPPRGRFHPGAELDAGREAPPHEPQRPDVQLRSGRPDRQRHRHRLDDPEQQRPRAVVRRDDARAERRPALGRVHGPGGAAARRSRSRPSGRPTCTAGRRTASSSRSPGSGTATSTSTWSPPAADPRRGSPRRRAWTMARSSRPMASGSTSTPRARAACRSGA